MITNPFNLNGKTIVITGASSGIGRQCAISCSNMGAKVILIARNEDRLKAVMDELGSENHAYYTLDLLSIEQFSSTIDKIVLNHGKISGYIHSAGIESTLPVNALNIDIYNKVFTTNVFSCFELIKLLSKKKNVPENGASFVIISSVMGMVGQKGKLAYCSSKSALINGAKALALELASKKIRVNSVSPAIVNTPLVTDLFLSMSEENKNEILKDHPLGFGDPEDVANACIFLLSQASKWVTGSNLVIDGGYSAK